MKKNQLAIILLFSFNVVFLSAATGECRSDSIAEGVFSRGIQRLCTLDAGGDGYTALESELNSEDGKLQNFSVFLTDRSCPCLAPFNAFSIFRKVAAGRQPAYMERSPRSPPRFISF